MALSLLAQIMGREEEGLVGLSHMCKLVHTEQDSLTDQ